MSAHKIAHGHDEARRSRQRDIHILEDTRNPREDIRQHEDADSDHRDDDHRRIDHGSAYFRKKIVFFLELQRQNFQYLLEISGYLPDIDHTCEELIEHFRILSETLGQGFSGLYFIIDVKQDLLESLVLRLDGKVHHCARNGQSRRHHNREVASKGHLFFKRNRYETIQKTHLYHRCRLHLLHRSDQKTGSMQVRCQHTLILGFLFATDRLPGGDISRSITKLRHILFSLLVFFFFSVYHKKNTGLQRERVSKRRDEDPSRHQREPSRCLKASYTRGPRGRGRKISARSLASI